MKSKGTISKRLISGKEYFYYQYLDNGKLVSKSVGEEEAYDLASEIYCPSINHDDFLSHRYNLEVTLGKSLYLLSRGYKKLKKRFCYESLGSFISNNQLINRIFILYGLRRTGKTTLIFQSINSLSIKDFNKTAYIKCNPNNTFYQLIDDLKYLTNNGIKYIYIDEITLLEDFVALSSVLSDIYGLMAKIVVSGTDSLGFLIASRSELFDRAIMLHTTYISFKEFAEVLNINSIDKYIEYGGTMSIEGNDYNGTINNVLSGTPNEYVDSAISHNIVHSLKVYKDGSYFASLYDLYEKGELVNVINRIVEDTNHRFAISVIENDFKSHDYGSLRQLSKLPNNDKYLGNVLDEVSEDQLTKDLMDALSIINVDRQTHKIDDNVIIEIEHYLGLLDVYNKVKEVNYPSFALKDKNVITQPGLRFSQAKALLKLLLNEPSIAKYKQSTIGLLEQKLLSDIKGRMLEELVLLEATKHNMNVFKFTFGPLGEYDMVVLDDMNKTIDICEIKYSSTINDNQTKFLSNEELNQIVETKYYPIKNRIVLYNGDTKEVDSIKYINVGEYLLSL